MKLQAFNLWRDLGGLARDSWVLALTTLINRGGAMVLPFMMLHLTRNLGLEATRAGLILSIYGVMSLIASPLAGKLSDRFGSVRLLELSLFSSGLVVWLLPLARNGFAASAGMAVLAVTSESFRPASMALVGELAPPGLRKQAFALNRLAINLGMSVGPAIGGILAVVSFRSIFWVNGATCLLAGIVLLLMPIAPPKRDAPEPQKPSVVSSDPSQSGFRLAYFMFALLPVIFVFLQHQGTMPLYMVQNLGLSEMVYGFMFTLNTILIVLFEVKINAATAHWTIGRALAVGSFFSGAGFGALAFARDGWSVAATVIVWTVGEMILFPASASYVSEISPAARRGEYMGYYAMTFGIGLALGPAAGTWMMERYGALALWAATFALGLLSTVLLGRVPNVHPARDPQLESSVADALIE